MESKKRKSQLVRIFMFLQNLLAIHRSGSSFTNRCADWKYVVVWFRAVFNGLSIHNAPSPIRYSERVLQKERSVTFLHSPFLVVTSIASLSRTLFVISSHALPRLLYSLLILLVSYVQS